MAAGAWSISDDLVPTRSTCSSARARASRMFTGIITDIGVIDAIEKRGDLRIRILSAYDTATIDLGASIACSGVCLTVVDKGGDWFAVDVSAETVACTARDQWTEGRRLNLERALKVGRSEEHTSELQSLMRISYA